MSKEDLIDKIVKGGIKLVMRRYPFVVAGEFINMYETKYTYKKLPDNELATAIRIILTIDPDIFFSMYSKKSYMYHTILDNRAYWTIRYLSNLYNKTDEDQKELENIESEILNIFYQTASFLNPNNKVGYLDFHVRYKFLGSKVDDSWLGFTDYDTSIPYPQYK